MIGTYSCMFYCWRPVLTEKGELCIKGNVKGVPEYVITENIVKRYNHCTVGSANGIFKIADLQASGLPEYIANKFKGGFPRDWYALLKLWYNFVFEGEPENFTWLEVGDEFHDVYSNESKKGDSRIFWNKTIPCSSENTGGRIAKFLNLEKYRFMKNCGQSMCNGTPSTSALTLSRKGWSRSVAEKNSLIFSYDKAVDSNLTWERKAQQLSLGEESSQSGNLIKEKEIQEDIKKMRTTNVNAFDSRSHQNKTGRIVPEKLLDNEPADLQRAQAQVSKSSMQSNSLSSNGETMYSINLKKFKTHEKLLKLIDKMPLLLRSEIKESPKICKNVTRTQHSTLKGTTKDSFNIDGNVISHQLKLRPIVLIEKISPNIMHSAIKNKINILRNWTPILTKIHGPQLQLQGYVDRSDKTEKSIEVTTSAMVCRLTGRLIITADSQKYQLDGYPINPGGKIPSKILIQFVKGIPKDWKQVLNQWMKERELHPGDSQYSSFSTSLDVLQESIPLNMSRSGRVLIPPLRYWLGERIKWDRAKKAVYERGPSVKPILFGEMNCLSNNNLVESDTLAKKRKIDQKDSSCEERASKQACEEVKTKKSSLDRDVQHCQTLEASFNTPKMTASTEPISFRTRNRQKPSTLHLVDDSSPMMSSGSHKKGKVESTLQTGMKHCCRSLEVSFSNPQLTKPSTSHLMDVATPVIRSGSQQSRLENKHVRGNILCTRICDGREGEHQTTMAKSARNVSSAGKPSKSVKAIKSGKALQDQQQSPINQWSVSERPRTIKERLAMDKQLTLFREKLSTNTDAFADSSMSLYQDDDDFVVDKEAVNYEKILDDLHYMDGAVNVMGTPPTKYLENLFTYSPEGTSSSPELDRVPLTKRQASKLIHHHLKRENILKKKMADRARIGDTICSVEEKTRKYGTSSQVQPISKAERKETSQGKKQYDVVCSFSEREDDSMWEDEDDLDETLF